MPLTPLQRNILQGKLNPKDYHPAAQFTPSHILDRSGERVITSDKIATSCPKCNSNNILPTKMPGFTLYKCLHRPCGHRWRDSYDAGTRRLLRPRQWRSLKAQVGNQYGRIII